jgi:hypothetical protein
MKEKKRNWTSPRATIAMLVMALLVVATNAVGQDAQDILQQVDSRQPTGTSRIELTMSVYRRAEDQVATREFRVHSYSDGDESTYMEFVEPKSIRGMRILSNDEASWVFFPSTGRARKIAGESQGQSVQGVGGDFSYEDLGGGKLAEDYTARLLSDDGQRWRLEGTPVEEDSSYTRLILTVQKDSYRLESIEYYSGSEHTKTLTLENYETADEYPTPMRMTMTNHNEGSKTVVENHSVEYRADVSAQYFNPRRFYR